MNHEQLAALFVGALPPNRQDEALGISGLRTLVGDIFDTGRALTPDVELDGETFLRYLAERVATAEQLMAALVATRGPDLYLACAAARGDARAIANVDAQIRTRVPAALQRMRLSASAIDDVMQLVRIKILVGDETRRPKITEYAGRGPLQGWLRVVAVRIALDNVRGNRSGANEDELMADVVGGTADPETQLIRGRNAKEFKASFVEAVAALPEKERVLLRLHFVDGLSLDEVGNFYRVHRATAARWIAHARISLLREIRTRLGARLGANESALDSVMRGVRSQLDVSLCKFLVKDD